MATPLELLTPKEDRIEPVLTKIWAPFSFGTIAFAAVCFANSVNHRPIFSGIQRHLIFTLGGAFLGNVVENYRKNYLAERDAVFRHYIELHPEDFPPPERKKFAEVFTRWTPVR